MNCCENILVALLVIACGALCGGAQGPICPDNGDEVCASCLARGDCLSVTPGDPPAEGDLCAAGEACKVESGVATCMPVADVPDCACGGANVGCDAYNPLLPIFCVKFGNSKRLFPKKECAAGESCVKGTCEKIPKVCEGFEGLQLTGYFPVTPECSSSVFCWEGEEINREPCDAGQYFNTESAACEAYPPNPCANCDKSKCPVITDCSKYVVCSKGKVVDDDESCDGDKIFNSETENCEDGPPASTETCARYADCNFELITTTQSDLSSSTDPITPEPTTPEPTTPEPTTPEPTTPEPTTPEPTTPEPTTPEPTTPEPTTPEPTTPEPTTPDPVTKKPPTCTAANANTRYPHDTNCKKYYTCRLVTRTSYRYVESTCSGSLVFNPETRYCDLPSEVPNCVPPQ